MHTDIQGGPPKVKQLLFLNSSVKHCPAVIIFGLQHQVAT